MSDIKRPEIKRVVLAYSGGLDTSVAKWLEVERGLEVVTFTALGQGEEIEPARAKACQGIPTSTSSSRTCARSSCAISSSR